MFDTPLNELETVLERATGDYRMFLLAAVRSRKREALEGFRFALRSQGYDYDVHTGVIYLLKKRW